MTFYVRKITQLQRKYKQLKRSLFQLEQAKILFQYLIVLCLAILAGILLSDYASQMLLYEYSTKHFSNLFRHFHSIASLSRQIVLYSLSDLIGVWISFLSILTAFHYFVSNVLLFYQGMRLGFLIAAIPILPPLSHKGEPALIVLFRLWITLAFLVHFYRMAFFYRSKRDGLLKNSIGNSALFSLLASGIILLSTAIYCGLIYII